MSRSLDIGRLSRMPALPFYWRHDGSVELLRAMSAYLANRLTGETVTDDQIRLVRNYLRQWVEAPCWNEEGFEVEIKHLRSTVAELESATEIADWIQQAMEIGLDPL